MNFSCWREACLRSDLDLLVDAMPGATLFDLSGLQLEPGMNENREQQ
jgi:predicted nucleotidyltransferase